MGEGVWVRLAALRGWGRRMDNWGATGGLRMIVKGGV